ncbi:MAG: hypothetical protein WA364_30785 [Candidatus Nitrosopolaris sp.]
MISHQNMCNARYKLPSIKTKTVPILLGEKVKIRFKSYQLGQYNILWRVDRAGTSSMMASFIITNERTSALA